MLCRHKFETMVTGVPRVLLSRDAALDIAQLVNLVSTEVGWLGTARRHGRDFLIERIFLPRQQVHHTTTELTAEGLAELAQDLIETEVDGVDAVNALRFWGHSHVNMDTKPSHQDDKQMELFEDNGCEWFLRGIFNKSGKAQFDIYLMRAGYTFHDVEWALLEEADQTERAARWQDEIDDKVSPIVFANQNTGTLYPPARHYQGGAQQRLADMDHAVVLDDNGDDGYAAWDAAVDETLVEMARKQPDHYGKRRLDDETALITKKGVGP